MMTNILTHVLEDIQERAEFDRGGYGEYLRTHDGKNPLWDAYQEAIDLVMCLRRAILEREIYEASKILCRFCNWYGDEDDVILLYNKLCCPQCEQDLHMEKRRAAKEKLNVSKEVSV